MGSLDTYFFTSPLVKSSKRPSLAKTSVKAGHATALPCASTSQFEFRTRPALALPLPYIPPQPTKFPSPQTLASHGYMLMVTGSDAIEALANGWKLYMWNTLGFTDVSTLGPLPLGTHEFASIHYRTKNPS